tara:strand:- start:58916 stop:59308 length:393 start_codon:yes stop_codon:yes gene_type:complete
MEKNLQRNKARSLLFVYNAYSGKVNALLDTAYKLFAPNSRSCNLCSITFGNFRENSRWKRFRKTASVETHFLHKDEFLKGYASKYGHSFTFPVVLAETLDGLEVCVGTEELQALPDTEALMELLRKRELL